MSFAELSLAVVGSRFENPRRKGQPTGDRQMEILLCEPGESVELIPEPQNKADENAIAVYSARGVQIGYIAADRTFLIHSAVGDTKPVRAVFQEATSWGCAIRVTFDANVPVLPPAHDAEIDLQPAEDAEWPEPDSGRDGVYELPPEE